MGRPCPTLPPVSQADLAEAWARYSAGLRGPNAPANLTQALADDAHGRTLRILAASIRKTRWQASAERRVDLVPAPRLGLDGHPMGWVTLPGLTWYDQPTNQSQQQSFL